MTVIMPPTPGEDQLLSPPELRLRPVERRRHERLPIELGVTAWTLGRATRRLSGSTVNLSVDGALVWLPGLGPRSRFLELSIAVPDGAVRASAGIVWRRDPLIGLQFQRISPDDQARLAELLRPPH
jgi:PilZ domain